MKKLIDLVKKDFRIKVLVIITILALGFCTIPKCLSYYFTIGSYEGETTVETLSFSPSTNVTTISLAETITNGKSFGPGAEGRFEIDADFTEVDTNSYYKLSYSRTALPNNIHFYVDEDCTTELDFLEGTELNTDTDRVIEHYVYWKWLFINDSTSNNDDSLYMDNDVTVTFTAHFSQRTESNTFKINDYERQSEMIDVRNTHASNNKGSFAINVDLSSLTVLDDYRIFFNRKTLSNNLHLYSDSNYQNEINYISGTYDGTNNTREITVYWELENDNLSTLTDGLNIVIVKGSW